MSHWVYNSTSFIFEIITIYKLPLLYDVFYIVNQIIESLFIVRFEYSLQINQVT